MLQNACVPEVMLTVSGYDPARGAVIQPEGGDVVVRHGESGIETLADPDELRDLARWCLVLADEQAPDGTHVHLEPGTEPLATTSMSLLISREGHRAI
jgi:hypothetical protein